MKQILIAILVAVLFLFPACQSFSQPVEDTAVSFEKETVLTQETAEPVQTVNPTNEPIEPTQKLTLKPTETPEPTSTEKPTETAKPTETVKPKQTSSPQPTTQPTVKPTEIPTPDPTAKPTPEPEVEIVSVSSSYINAAMAEINRLRKENGVPPATYSGSISSSCQSHAEKMAESGSPFHASGTYMFEAVGRASRHMSGGTMGGSAANHVVQLQSEEVTKIGIGAVYYGDYVFYVVRGD